MLKRGLHFENIEPMMRLVIRERDIGHFKIFWKLIKNRRKFRSREAQLQVSIHPIFRGLFRAI